MRPDLGPQDGQRHVRHLLAASRGCPPRTHAAAPSGCIGRLRVPQDYSSRGRALERRRYTCADVARVKWLLVQGRRQVVGLSVVSACSRECSTVCDSHGCSWVGHGAGGRSGAPQQPPWLTPIHRGCPQGPKKERKKEMGHPRSQHFVLASREIESVTRRVGRWGFSKVYPWNGRIQP